MLSNKIFQKLLVFFSSTLVNEGKRLFTSQNAENSLHSGRKLRPWKFLFTLVKPKTILARVIPELALGLY